MSDPQIIRPRLRFDREFGQHRNWWVRDPRICGNPLSILLYLLSQDPQLMPTQTEAREELGLGVAAWQTGKQRLLDAGFLVEIRDRYPRDSVGTDGRPRGGQRRFRLFLQDPEPGYRATSSEALIELDEPYEQYLQAALGDQCGKSALVTESPGQTDSGKSAVAKSQCAENPQSKENPQSFKEEKTKPSWSVGYISPSNQPTTPAADARVAEIDAALSGLHPDLRLTYAQIEREVSGRVDLGSVDVERAVLDTVIRAAERGQKVENPARYVASVIVRNPGNWPVGAAAPAPFDPLGGGTSEFDAPSCARGDHWWGSERLPELDRAHCERCGTARRTVDPTFAALEDELSSIGGEF